MNFFNLLKISLMLFLIGALGACVILYQKLSYRQPINFENFKNQRLITIPPKQSLHELSVQLEAQGIITSKWLFTKYLVVRGLDTKVQSGVYFLSESMSIMELAHMFSAGNTATQKVTIPEGITSWEIYDIVSNYFELDSNEFHSLIHNEAFALECGIEDTSLEGYLYPDTYKLPYDLDERNLLILMTSQFKKKFQTLDTNSSAIFKKLGKRGVLTLASIVEEEAAVNSEQKEIAGVFCNRLQHGWPLGADPTVRFALKKLTGSIRGVDLKTSSLYNTRVRKGLPPGPISNPGLSAIKATLYPNKTVNMFFVAKDDGSREHYFSVTNDQHNEYKLLRLQNRKNQIIPNDSMARYEENSMLDSTFDILDTAVQEN